QWCRGPTTPSGDLCCTALSERRVVRAILRSPKPRPGSYGNLRLVGSDSGNCCVFLEDLEAGWCFDGPLSSLGKRRRGSECHDLAAELIRITQANFQN